MPLLPSAVLLAMLGVSLGAQHFLAQPYDTTASRGETVSTHMGCNDVQSIAT